MIKDRNWTKWLKCAMIRALKTFSQTILAIVAIGSTFSDVNWQQTLSMAGVAALLSILTSIVGLPEEKTSYEQEETKEVLE